MTLMDKLSKMSAEDAIRISDECISVDTKKEKAAIVAKHSQILDVSPWALLDYLRFAYRVRVPYLLSTDELELPSIWKRRKCTIDELNAGESDFLKDLESDYLKAPNDHERRRVTGLYGKTRNDSRERMEAYLGSKGLYKGDNTKFKNPTKARAFYIDDGRKSERIVKIISFVIAVLIMIGVYKCAIDARKNGGSPSSSAIEKQCQLEADTAVYKAARLGVKDQAILRDMHRKIMRDCQN